MTKAKHSTRKNKISRKGHKNGDNNPLPGRTPSRAFLSALKAVERLGKKKR